MNIKQQTPWIIAAAFTLLMITSLTIVGCENKEKVLDVETPGGAIEIERNTDTGAVGVEIDKKN